MTFDLTETFYFKPDAGRIMVSSIDMEPTAPCDALVDELELANVRYPLCDRTGKWYKPVW